MDSSGRIQLQAMRWEHAKVRVTPQTRALRKRTSAGLSPAKPRETQRRVAEVLDLMHRGLWFGFKSVVEKAREWNVSTKRVQQIAAEAGRMY